MDSATILVLVLCAGVVALLMWFEINSRRNEASKKAAVCGRGNVTARKAGPLLNRRATKRKLHSLKQSEKRSSS